MAKKDTKNASTQTKQYVARIDELQDQLIGTGHWKRLDDYTLVQTAPRSTDPDQPVFRQLNEACWAAGTLSFNEFQPTENSKATDKRSVIVTFPFPALSELVELPGFLPWLYDRMQADVCQPKLRQGHSEIVDDGLAAGFGRWFPEPTSAAWQDFFVRGLTRSRASAYPYAWKEAIQERFVNALAKQVQDAGDTTQEELRRLDNWLNHSLLPALLGENPGRVHELSGGIELAKALFERFMATPDLRPDGTPSRFKAKFKEESISKAGKKSTKTSEKWVEFRDVRDGWRAFWESTVLPSFSSEVKTSLLDTPKTSAGEDKNDL